MKRTQITIKSEHFEEIRKMTKHSTLHRTPEEYLDYILDELLIKADTSSAQEDKSELLEQRLRDLGYL